jgi:UPF0271 protein
MRASIDINCDLGEGCPNDAELMRYISSANIACGFHAGDDDTMKRTVELAIENNVAVGCHPGYNDKQNFGRMSQDLSFGEIYDIVIDQILRLRHFCEVSGTGIKHIKPHGALYNQAAKNREIAAAIVEGICAIDSSLSFYGLANSVMLEEAERVGLRSVSEVFADRTYQPDGTLTPRSQPNALIDDVGECIEHVLRMVREQKVIVTDGSEVPIRADTVCIHGDGEHAVEFAKAVNEALIHEGIEIMRPIN